MCDSSVGLATAMFAPRTSLTVGVDAPSAEAVRLLVMRAPKMFIKKNPNQAIAVRIVRAH